MKAHNIITSEMSCMSLSFIKHRAMEMYKWSGGIAPRLLNLGTRRTWVVSFTPGRFTSGERTPGIHWI